VRRRTLAAAATVTGIAAALVAGYAAAGPTGLIDAASVATLGVLIVARAAVRGEKPVPVREKRAPRKRRQEFPAYVKIASDLEWARMSQRHYEHTLRPRLSRLAATLGKTVDLTGPEARDTDGPGVDLATLERIITQLEDP
jgi:hypothetical protein